MVLNDFSSDIDWQVEFWMPMWNISEQISETYKEEVKKWTVQIKKTRKDEKRAKKQDLLLSKFLVKILIDKRYDDLFPDLFKSFDAGVPSNLILGILSLVYIEISNEIRWYVGKKIINFNFYSNETISFSGNNLPQTVKDRVNSWVEDIVVIALLNSSEVYTNRIIYSIKNSKELNNFTAYVLKYFLSEINIYMSEEISKEYAIFIMNKIILPKIKK